MWTNVRPSSSSLSTVARTSCCASMVSASGVSGTEAAPKRLSVLVKEVLERSEEEEVDGARVGCGLLSS